MTKRNRKSEEVEAALLERLQRLERRIQNAKAEQTAVKTLLSAHRREQLRYKGAIRKNSFNKLLVQKKIVDALRAAGGRPVSVQRLLKAVNDGQEFEIASTTFRSHLYRMKQDGLIVAGDVRGSYRLSRSAQIQATISR